MMAELEAPAKRWHDSIEWTTVVFVILTWLMSAALTYGVVSTKINYLESRVAQLERDQAYMLQHYLTRDEYQKFHEQLEKKMTDGDKSLSDKLDTIILMHTDSWPPSKKK